MKYVGFFEDMHKHAYRIQEEVFTNVEVPWIFPFIWWILSFVAAPKFCVKKYSSLYTKEQLQMLEQRNRLDMELYNWAREQFDPNLRLYDSYLEFFWENFWWTFLGFVFFLGLCLLCLVRCCCRSSSKIEAKAH